MSGCLKARSPWFLHSASAVVLAQRARLRLIDVIRGELIAGLPERESLKARIASLDRIS